MSTSLPDRQRSGCPLCGQSPRAPHTPFCSAGCRDRDLLQWLGDGYRIPGPVIDDEADSSGLDKPD
jgi:endogenous inhibitor of DNA gyrase (YacG/DUF329 family)